MLGQDLASDHERGVGILQHEAEACFGIVGIERQIGPPCLEDGQETHDELGRALQTHPDHDLGPDARSDELAREPVRSSLERTIGEGCITGDDRQVQRRFGGLRGE